MSFDQKLINSWIWKCTCVISIFMTYRAMNWTTTIYKSNYSNHILENFYTRYHFFCMFLVLTNQQNLQRQKKNHILFLRPETLNNNAAGKFLFLLQDLQMGVNLIFIFSVTFQNWKLSCSPFQYGNKIKVIIQQHLIYWSSVWEPIHLFCLANHI